MDTVISMLDISLISKQGEAPLVGILDVPSCPKAGQTINLPIAVEPLGRRSLADEW
jgi:hypothetical protein